MFVGEAPGKREDELGEPFVGRSGEVLDEVLNGLGLSREEVRISNVVRCRPPGNRDPRSSEVDNCRDYLEDEVAHFEPEVLCTLGRVAASSLLGEPVSMGESLGRRGTMELGGVEVEVFLSYHPAATLYDKSKRPVFEQGLEEAVGLVR